MEKRSARSFLPLVVPFSFDTYDNRRCGIDNLFPVLIVKIISSPAPRDGRADIRAYKTQPPDMSNLAQSSA
jgi:hypothetical protein